MTHQRVRMAKTEFIWLIEVDWPEELNPFVAVVATALPGQAPVKLPQPQQIRRVIPEHYQKIKAAAVEFEQWLDTNIGPSDWTPDYAEVNDDHDLFSNHERAVFVLRVKTEEQAALIKMRYS